MHILSFLQKVIDFCCQYFCHSSSLLNNFCKTECRRTSDSYSQFIPMNPNAVILQFNTRLPCKPGSRRDL